MIVEITDGPGLRPTALPGTASVVKDGDKLRRLVPHGVDTGDGPAPADR
ncbi:hypothetical protein IMZ11_06700 [Microtetraspora sp. AC03309]|nr:hypothetical protein [Microtetraspora sp. AC03309]MCC5575331.1 hypothetical protein [Microtetraspora sp. AC03309]